MSNDLLTGRTTELADYWEWERLVRDNRWSDGLPVAPPTEERVQEIIDYIGLPPTQELAVVAPADGIATVEQVAIQCAMAGCLPEHSRVVVAALNALTDPAFNLHGVQTTTNPCAPLTIVNGPIARRLGFNVGNGAFGGGGHANAAIGRAVRLILWNIGGARPSENDMSPLGHPAKLSFCIAENTDQSPWDPYHTDFGFEQDDDAVVEFACTGPYPAMVNGAPERILGLLAEALASPSTLAFHAAGQMLVALSIRPAMALANAGYARHDVRRYLYEHAKVPVGYLRAFHILEEPLSDSSMIYWGHSSLVSERPDPRRLPDHVMLPLIQKEEDIHVLVTGGDSQWWAGICQGWGLYGGQAVAKPI